MPAARRQPLSELPLSSFVVTDQSRNGASSKPVKSSFDAQVLLSPPKRRILAEEGLASPSKSPARRLMFRTPAPDLMQENSLAGLVHASREPSPRRQTAPPPSPSKLSVTTTSTRGSSPITRSRTRSLAPSPELPDSPMSRDTTPEPASASRPTSLKRLRSAGSTVSGSPSGRSPTPKRRNMTAEIDMIQDDDADYDKENVPPPKKKKAAAAKGVPSIREASPTPRATKQRGGTPERSSTEERRLRRAALEAEVDQPDEF